MKAHFSHYLLHKFPFHSIISLTHIKLKGRISLLSTPSVLHIMVHLIGNKHIIRDQTPWHKSTLIWRYNIHFICKIFNYAPPTPLLQGLSSSLNSLL